MGPGEGHASLLFFSHRAKSFSNLLGELKSVGAPESETHKKAYHKRTHAWCVGSCEKYVLRQFTCPHRELVQLCAKVV